MKNSVDLISIIVPCYNVEQYLPKCVDSILNQTYTNLEVWLVDDGSPDRCGDICDEYARKDARIKVIHKENGGLADARNVAIDVATGEWIICVDSDDYLPLDHVEFLYNLVTKNNSQIACGSREAFFEGEEPNKVQPKYSEHTYDKWKAIQLMFNQEEVENYAWAKIYHRSVFATGVRYPKGLLYEDLPTTYRLFLLAEKITICNKNIYYYLLRKNSIEGAPFNVRKLNSALTIFDLFAEQANELKPVEKFVRVRLFSFALHILLEMPSDYPDERKHILIDYVKANRFKVMLNSKARKKARIAGVLSFLGLRGMKWALSKVKERGE